MFTTRPQPRAIIPGNKADISTVNSAQSEESSPASAAGASRNAAKIAPAPSGPVTADNFRLFEALQAHTVPIADTKEFWNMLFDPAFPIVDKYAQLPGYIKDQLWLWPANTNRITAWWMHTKRQYTRWLLDDLTELGAL